MEFEYEKAVSIYKTSGLKPYVFSMLLKAGGTFTDLLIPLIMGVLIDTGIATGDTAMITRLCILMLVVAIASLSMNLSGHYLSAHSTQAMGANMRDAIYKHIQGMTIASVDEVTTASLITRNTNDVEHVIRTLLMVARMMMRAPIVAIGGTILALFIDPWLYSGIALRHDTAGYGIRICIQSHTPHICARAKVG